METDYLKHYIKVELNPVIRQKVVNDLKLNGVLTDQNLKDLRAGKRISNDLLPLKTIKQINKNYIPKSEKHIDAIVELFSKKNKEPLNEILNINEEIAKDMYYKNHLDIFTTQNNQTFLHQYIYDALLVAREQYDLKGKVEFKVESSTKFLIEENADSLEKIIPNNIPFSYFEKEVLEKYPTWDYTTDMTDPTEYYNLSDDSLQVMKATISAFYKSVEYSIIEAFKCSDMKCKEHNNQEYYVTKLPYSEVKWFGSTIKCGNILGYNDQGAPQYCNKSCSVDSDLTKTKTMYLYSMRVKIKNKNPNEPNYEEIKAFSTKQLKRFGHQIVAGFKLNNKSPTEKIFMIIDVEDVETHSFKLPEINHQSLHILEVVKNIDNFIYTQIKQKVNAVEKVKSLLLIQATYQNIFPNKFMNAALLGAPSSGKTYVSKKYLPVLYPNYLFTTGMRISEPAMRGTTTSVPMISGKEEKVETVGHLGTYKVILIEEGLGQIQTNGTVKGISDEMKDEFEIENTEYSNNKAFSNNIGKKKTANIILTGNIDSNHKEKYITKIKMKLKTPEEGSFDAVPPMDLNLSYNLDINEYRFDPRIQKKIAEVRQEYYDNGIDWSVGFEVPIAQRYPFKIVFENTDLSNTQNERITILKNTFAEPSNDRANKNDNRASDEEAKYLENDTMQIFYDGIKDFKNKCYSLPHWGEIEDYNLLKYDEASIELGVNIQIAREQKVPAIIFETLRLIEREERISDRTLSFGKDLLRCILNPTSIKDLSLYPYERATYTGVLNKLKEGVKFNEMVEQYHESQQAMVRQLLIKIKNNERCYPWIKYE